MPDTLTSRDNPDSPAIGLAEMIDSLRLELQTALQRGQGTAVRFDVEKVELELEVALSRKAKGEAGVAFWVVKAGASGEAGHETTHTFKLTLVPQAAGGGRLLVNSESDKGPSPK